ncbi:glycosyltransferase family 4 protein [Flavobacterium sp. 3-210]
MKILIIINNLITGGAEKLILETLPLLRKKGIDIDLLLLSNKKYPYLEQLEKQNCCTIYSFGNRSIYSPLNVFKIIPYLKKYDLIHVHLFPALYWTALAKFISFSNVKLVFTEHSTSNKRLKNKFFKPIDCFIYSFYTTIICITEEVKNVFMSHTNLKESRFEVITNGINLKKINEAIPLPRNLINKNIQETDKLIIQIAGFRIEKDQKTVIRSLRYLNSDVKLILVGDGNLQRNCEELVNELNLQDRVFFLGVRNDVPNLLKTCDISIISSHWEGFGLAAVEGMASRKPLVASNVLGLANVVGNGGVLFEKGNEIDLANKIQKLFSNAEYFKKKSDDGYERAKHFDINLMIDRQINLYNKLTK